MKKVILLLLLSSLKVSVFAEERSNTLLTEEEQELLEKGPVPNGRRIAGGVTGSIVGFGVGHMITGHWRESGWRFTLGEAASYGAMIYGAYLIGNELNDSSTYYDSRRSSHRGDSKLGTTLILAGAAGFIGFRIWEVIDLWVRPARQNREYKALRERLEQKVSLGLSPNQDGGMTASLAIRF